MGQFIIKLTDEKENKDYYLMWSTIVDAPVSYGMPLAEFKEYYIKERGNQGRIELEERLKRCEEKGISAHYPYDDLNSYFEYNRAGEKETHLDKEGLLDKYCRNVHA